MAKQIFRLIIIFTSLLISSKSMNADIVFTITGDNSDSIVEWSLSGSITVDQSIVAESNDDLLFPTLSSLGWDHLANVGNGGIISTKFIGHGSISGSPTISINGGQNLFAGIGLNNVGFVDNPGEDSFQFLFEGLATHSALSPGDVVTYSGSGSIDLGSAKSTIFEDGVYVGERLLHDSARFKMVISSVPEPSSIFGVGILGVVALIRRPFRRPVVT